MMSALRKLGRRDSRATIQGTQPPERASIFVTVGTELPFDRLVHAIDRWAWVKGRGADVFAQVGNTMTPPSHIGWAHTIGGADFERLFRGADLIVAHAGMGTIIKSLEQARPLVVVPRRARLGEHRNDHQLATVARLSDLGLVTAASDEHAVIGYLDGGELRPKAVQIGSSASTSLSERLAREIRAEW